MLTQHATPQSAKSPTPGSTGGSAKTVFVPAIAPISIKQIEVAESCLSVRKKSCITSSFPIVGTTGKMATAYGLEVANKETEMRGRWSESV
jgi:hypothetical protein